MSRDAVEIEKVDKALFRTCSKRRTREEEPEKALTEFLADLKHASMDDLQSAAKRLQEELKGSNPKHRRICKDFTQAPTSKQRSLERAKEWEGQESLFIRMTKRLSVYMAAYGSLSAITSYVKGFRAMQTCNSDSICRRRPRPTGLNAKELAKLGEDIRAIDTRTAQEQLYELAAAAGQLGIKSEAEVAGPLSVQPI